MHEHRIVYEEVPGSRTTQDAVIEPQRERIAYEELQPGDIIQEGDEWRSECGRWQQFVLTQAKPYQVRDTLRVRRPYKITALQDERDELKTALRESHAAHAFTTKQGLAVCKERDEACRERDLARTEVARLSTELWARKPLEDRVAALTDEVTQLRAERQEWIDRCNAESARALRLSEQLSAAEVALKSAQRARDELQRQVDELRAGLMGVVSAEHVHLMLEDMLDQTEWVGQCLDSSTYEQMSCIQRTIANVAERVRNMVKEGASAND